MKNDNLTNLRADAMRMLLRSII